MTEKDFLSKRRSRIATAGVFFVLLLFLAAGLLLVALGDRSEEHFRVTAAEVRPTVILDAGHGGEDGGAVGGNGVFEKDLNLTLAQTLADMLRAAGVEVVLTRTEDRLLYREEENIKGHRKEYDLKNRLSVAEKYPDAIFVSLHMNTFPVAKYSGLQVYYAARTEGSRELAECLQAAVRRDLQPQNERKTKPSDSSIYLLDRAVGQAVLVECGFLSNPEECRRLSEKDYQRQLCFSLFCGMMEYINQKEGLQ